MATTAEWTDYWRRLAEAQEKGETPPEPPEGEPEFIKGVTPGLGPTFEDWLAEQSAPEAPTILSIAPRSKSVAEFALALTNPNERDWQRFVYPMELSRAEAQVIGMNIQQGWILQFTGVNALGDPEWNLLDPTRKVFKPGQAPTVTGLITPPIPTGGVPPLAENPEDIIRRLWPGQQGEDLISLGQRNTGAFLDFVKAKGRTPDTEALVQSLGGSWDEVEAETQLPISQRNPELTNLFQRALPRLVKTSNADAMMTYFLENPESIRSALFALGRNRDTEALVGGLYGDITPEQMKGFFSIRASAIQQRAEDRLGVKKGFWGDLGDIFVAGTGDILTGIGGAAKWLGAKGVGETISQAGQYMQAYAPPDEFGEFQWKQMLNPKWATTRLTRLAPNLMLLAIPGIGGASLGGSVAVRLGITGATKLGMFGKAALQGIGAGVAARPLESAMEAAGTYDAAKAKGLSDTEAEMAATQTFKNNMKLAGIDAVQWGVAFLPAPFRVVNGLVSKGLVTTARIGGKMVFTGLTEGGEELYQQIVQKQSLGEEIDWSDPELKEVFALGTMAGVGFGGGVDILSKVQNGFIKRLNPEQLKVFTDDKANLIEQGLSEMAATEKALDNVVEVNPDLAKVVEEVVKKTETEVTLEQVKPTNEVDKVVWEQQKARLMEEQGITPTEAAKPTMPPPGVEEGVAEKAAPGVIEIEPGRRWEIRVQGEQAGEVIDNRGNIIVFGGGKSWEVSTRAAAFTKLRELAKEHEKGIARRPPIRAIPKAKPEIPKPEPGMPEAEEVGQPEKSKRQKPLPKKYTDQIREESPDAATAKENIAKARQAYNEGDITTLEEMGLEELSQKLQSEAIEAEEKAIKERAKQKVVLPEITAKVTPPEAPPPEPSKAPPEPFPKKEGFAANIRLEKYSEEVRDDIKKWANEHPAEVQEARRGVRSDAQVKADAARLVEQVGGDAAGFLAKWKPGTTWNAEELVAIRGLLEQKTKEVVAAQKAVKADDSTENLLKLQLAIREQTAIQEVVHGVTAEAGRALRSFRQSVFDAIKSNDAEKMNKLLDQVGSRENVEKLAELMSHLDLNDPIAVSRFVNSISKTNAMDYLTALFYNSILSGPKTHIVNALSNAANTFFSPIERAVSLVVDIPLAPIQGRAREHFFNEVPADVFGAIRGVPEGFRQFAYVIKNGISLEQATKWEFRKEAFKGKTGAVINIPSRMLEAADQLFKAINTQAALNAEAHRMASKEGLKGLPFEQRVAEILSDPPTELLERVDKIAEYRLFRQKPGSVTQGLINIREKDIGIKGFKPLRFFMPFLRTPTNLVKYGLERSPLGLLNPKLWQNVAQKNPEAADQIARVMIGSIGFGAMAWYAAAGFITGAAPRDRAERERFYREGKQPFAVRIDGFWVSYQRLEPLNQMLSQVSIMVEAIRNDEKDIQEKMLTAINTLGQNLVSQTYMSSLSDLINAFAEPERFAGKWFNRFASSMLVPASSATRTAVQMFDRIVREPDNAWETIEASIPGLSNRVKAKLTALGESIERKSPPWFPINVTPVEETILSQELERLKFDIGFVGKTVAGMELAEDEQRKYQELAGQQTKKDLERLMLAPDYWTANDVEKEKMLRKVVDTARDFARTKLRQQIWSSGSNEDRLKVMREALLQADSQLGKVISQVPEFSHEPPDIYDMGKELDASYRSLLQDIPESALKGVNIPTTVHSWYVKNEAIKTVNGLRNTTLIRLNSDAKKGSTFEDYHNQWLQRSVITDEKLLAEFDAKNDKAYLGNMTKRQLDLLRQYHNADEAGKARMVIENPELVANPRLEWFESHPTENAHMALWGDAKLMTKEAYQEALELVKTLDIPDSVVKDRLPDKATVDDTFAIVDIEKKNRLVFDAWDTTSGLDDTIKGKDGLTERDKAQAKLKADNPNWLDDKRRIEMLKSRIETVEQEQKPFDDKLVDAHVAYMKLQDAVTSKEETEETGAAYAKAKLFRADDKTGYDAWRTSLPKTDKLYLKPIDLTRVPIWRIDVKFAKEDTAYQAILAKFVDDDIGQAEATAIYLENNEAYRIARRQRDFYELHVPIPAGKEAEALRDKFVTYYNEPEPGFRQERYLLENRDLEDILVKYKGRLTRVNAADIPDVRWDELAEQFKTQDVQYTSLTEDKARTAYMQANPKYQQSVWSRNAYEMFIGQEKFVPDYVQYQVTKTKPGRLPFEDDWFLIERPEFYRAMVDMGYWQPKDFSKVPTRHVWSLVQVYDDIMGDETMTRSEARVQMRRTYPELDSWLAIVGLVKETLAEHDREAKRTPAEKRARELQELRELVAAKRKALGVGG